MNVFIIRINIHQKSFFYNIKGVGKHGIATKTRIKLHEC